MKELYAELERLEQNTEGDKNVIKTIKKEKSLFPFSAESSMLTYFLSIGEISFALEKYRLQGTLN